ncbi:MAG: hypothetical protein AAF639_16845 [Chloroflexota bacterium]
MSALYYTLITDGRSDAILIPILNWLLEENGVNVAIEPQLADLASLPKPPKTLAARIGCAIEMYPCDLLFVHRDAEREPRDVREDEIRSAYLKSNSSDNSLPCICVIPVRMSEAWLLFDENALRHAVGNRSKKIPLELPSMHKLESLPDPKQTLHELLLKASGAKGRERKRFNANRSVHRIGDIIDDFSPLRSLSAFSHLENDIKQFIHQYQHNQ